MQAMRSEVGLGPRRRRSRSASRSWHISPGQRYRALLSPAGALHIQRPPTSGGACTLTNEREPGEPDQGLRLPSRVEHAVACVASSRAVSGFSAPPEENIALWIYPALPGMFCTALDSCIRRPAVRLHPRTGGRRSLICGVFLRSRLLPFGHALRMRKTDHNKQSESRSDHQS